MSQYPQHAPAIVLKRMASIGQKSKTHTAKPMITFQLFQQKNFVKRIGENFKKNKKIYFLKKLSFFIIDFFVFFT